MPTNSFQYTAEENEALDRDMRKYLAEQEIANRLQEKEDRYRRELEGKAQESAANAALAQRFVEQSLSKGAPAATGMRRSWNGPMPNRPVVNGQALVSAEELADFRRQFGAQMTLRDLLNADRRGAPAQQASAQNMKARGPQGVNSLPLPPGMIPGGAAGPAAAGYMPGEAERNIMNALMAIAPMLPAALPAAQMMRAGMVARSAPAAQAARIDPTGIPTLWRNARLPAPLPANFSALTP